ncbi:MAG: hypothetical protein M8467_12935, partial [Anaerolineae bacterium]|nr:hypothetical protein [Anaerolineae bacterium]
MHRQISFTFGVLLACLLATCATTPSMPQATAPPQETVRGPAGVEATPMPASFPLSEPGPYFT